MTRTAKQSRPAAPKGAPAAVHPVRSSWTALVAATTLGVAGASMVRADVQSNARLDDRRNYRLIVQSYDDGDASSPGSHQRPIASTQRAVTAAELKEGVRVDLLELRHDRRQSDGVDVALGTKPLVLAWVEEGRADLELDGLRARPRPGSLLGVASRTSDAESVQISVRAPSRAA